MSCVQIEGLGSDASQRRSCRRNTVCPGLHVFGTPSDPTPPTRPTTPPTTPTNPTNPTNPTHTVIWWDPRNLELKAEPPLGIRRSELIVKDVAPRTVEAGLADYTAWRTRTDACRGGGRTPIDCGADRDAVVEDSSGRRQHDAAAGERSWKCRGNPTAQQEFDSARSCTLFLEPCRSMETLMSSGA